MTGQQPKKKWPYVLGALVLLGVVLGAVALWRLDAFLLQRARTEAAQLAQTLGRPVEVGAVHTRLFPHLGVAVEEVVIGAAEGEEVPLARLERLSVGVALGPLLSTRGEDIQVTDVEARGLTVNYVRLPDGTTNVSRVQERLAQQAEAEPEPEAPAERDLSAVRVDRAALTDATIRFIDRTDAQARELAIRDLDVEVRDLRAGRPLEVVLKAAVLAEQQNLEVRLTTAPLPPSLTPVPERVVLKAEPIDLTPLGPFLGPDVGLLAGTVRADWSAELGAAVPGGTGATRLAGQVRAEGLRFAGAEGGRALDVVVDTDVRGDVEKGDLALDTLEVALGPARLTGKGRVQGLLTQTPVVEDFELVGRNLDPALLAQYYPPLRRQLADQVAGPIGLVVRGGGTQQQQSLTAEVDLTPVRLRLPEQLTKAAGAPMRLTSRLTGAAANGGALRFDARADLTGADLRPGLVLDKQPGQRFTVDTAGTYQPARGRMPMRVDLNRLDVALREYTMTGTASVALAGEGRKRTTTFNLAAKSPRLNADELLLSDEQVAALYGEVPEEPKDPARFQGMRGDVLLEVGSLRMSDMELSNLVAEVRMVDDLIQVQRFTTGLYGGTVTAGGSSVRLGPEPERRPFELKAQMRGVNAAEALAASTPRKVLSGTFNGELNLQGVGYEVESLQRHLAGAIQGDLLGGVFFGLDIPAAVSAPLAKALPFAARALPGDGVTRLAEQLPFRVTIQNGVAQLASPITWTRPDVAMSFSGGIGLDGRLDLKGTVNLGPPLIQRITQGRVTPEQPIPLNLALVGPAWSPEVRGLDVRPAAESIAKQAARGAARGLLGEKGRAVEGLITDGPEAAKQRAREEAERRQRELEEKAAQERARREEQARQEAERAKQRAEEEAKKRLRGLFGR